MIIEVRFEVGFSVTLGFLAGRWVAGRLPEELNYTSRGPSRFLIMKFLGPGVFF